MFMVVPYRGLGADPTALDLSALADPSGTGTGSIDTSTGSTVTQTIVPVDASAVNAFNAANMAPYVPLAPTTSINWTGVLFGLGAFGLVFLVAPRGRR